MKILAEAFSCNINEWRLSSKEGFEYNNTESKTPKQSSRSQNNWHMIRIFLRSHAECSDHPWAYGPHLWNLLAACSRKADYGEEQMISQLSPETRYWVYSSPLHSFGLETTHNTNNFPMNHCKNLRGQAISLIKYCTSITRICSGAILLFCISPKRKVS